MGTAHTPRPVKLFLACMYSSESVRDRALKLIEERYGAVEQTAGPLHVAEYTGYYTEEMGARLGKWYMIFKQEIESHELAAIKTFTNEIEQAFAVEGRRVVNCDPGYVANDKLVLASTKDFFHRIYLADGIYAEVTLHYRHGRYRHFSWTYPDYKSPEVIGLLESARATLVRDFRRGAAGEK